MGPLASRPKSRGPILLGGRSEPQPLADPVRPIDTRQLIDGVLALARGQSPISSEEQQARAWGVQQYDPSRTYCPPVTYKITGIGPGQANDRKHKDVYSGLYGPDIPSDAGFVGIRPQDFIARDEDRKKYKDQLRQVTFQALWDQALRPSNGADPIPMGLPSQGPYRASGNIGGQRVRLEQPHHIDLYRYADLQQAENSTRYVPVIRSFPKTARDLQCL